jgi:hypothetical protein
MTWFLVSDECPVCRHEESEDPIIKFKKEFHEKVSQNYLEAIRSLESDVSRYRRRLHRALREE